MLLSLEKRPRPKAEWPAVGANAWPLEERNAEAAAAMGRAGRISHKSDYWHRVTQLWPHTENPEIAPTLVKR